METFDRANYRQSGSSLDSNNEFKKKKNAKIFKFGMFKYGVNILTILIKQMFFIGLVKREPSRLIVADYPP